MKILNKQKIYYYRGGEQIQSFFCVEILRIQMSNEGVVTNAGALFLELRR